MIQQLLPRHIAAVDTHHDRHELTLFPEEEAHIREAVPKRRHEYTTARWCARRALAQLGLPAAPITPGHRGAPQWHPSVTGSITHCAGYRAAAVAHRSRTRALGIDAEPHQPLPEGVLESIALPAECAWVRRHARTHPGTHWDRLLFSIKETVYKTWYPLTAQPLEFEDALITPHPETHTFTAQIFPHRPTPYPTTLTGHYTTENGIILTTLTIPNDED
ncbi:4'-phosphopantetheinyl transferase superfamily protein [Streptomyces sp. NPDC046866]|uniref:4'-phosphopantetheinyl transferase family protein n=1 Tax=Streptomyces sp. NPDC046866 TaxID=3154921 RepID=UPI003454CD5E